MSPVRSVRSLVAAAAAALVLGGCGQSGSGGGSPGSGYPQPGPEGTPVGEPALVPVTQQGAVLASSDGSLVIEVPTGAAQSPAELTVQEVANLAPGGVGPAWKLGPQGTTFAKPVTLTFYAGSVGLPLDEVTVTWQDEQGYWHRAVPSSVYRDPVAHTLTVQTTHFSSWTLTTTPTAQDFTGAFTVSTTLGIPFTATGTATYTYAGEDAAATYYLLSGTLTLPSPLTSGTVTCTPTPPETPVFALRTNVGELSKGAPAFDWAASGAWDLTCSDGTTRLVSVAFDTQGIGFTGCTSAVTTPEQTGASATSGGLAWDCSAKGLGVTSGSWSFQSAACGTACVPSDPCKTGVVDCSTGTATCVVSGNVLDGATCGTNQVCNAGTCVGCTAGLACTPANPCSVGVTSCSTGTSVCVDSTTPATPVADGTSCGTDLVCSAGACVSCVAGLACTPSTNPCHQGSTSCSTGTSVCQDSGFPALDGTSCGTGLTCFSGACVACVQGSTCTSSNPCVATATYDCTSGSPTCTPQTLQPAGTACPGGVCSAAGVCNACSAGASCTPSNPCLGPGVITCDTGGPVCTPTGAPLAPGTACGTGAVCSADLVPVCIACNQGATCPSPDPCLVGTTVCSSGTPTCVATATPVANGTSCGTNLVCNAGVCSPCTAGATCTSTNPCTTLATIACGTGTPVCTDQSWLAAGAGCGTNQVCSSAHVCTACTQGASCTPTNPCATSGTTQCGTGTPVCADQYYVAQGTSCGANLVCSPAGVCTSCTQDATCTSTNPCDLTATIECSSGTPTCTDRTYKPDGTFCGTNLACSAGKCVPTRTVTGSYLVTYWPDAGATSPAAPPNAASAAVAALVNVGGAWSTFPGSVTAAGAVSVPGVPAGPLWLSFKRPGDAFPTYLDTTGGSPVDLGYDQLGRSDVTRAASSTVGSFSLSGLGSWPNGTADQVQMASSNADVWDRLARSSGTTFRDNFFTPNVSVGPLNLPKTNDAVTIWRMVASSVTVGGAARSYWSSGVAGSSSTVNVNSGQTTTATAYPITLAAPTNGAVVVGTWSLTTWEALRAAMNLPATGGTHNLAVGASTGPLGGNGPVPRNASPTLWTMTIAGPATADLAFAATFPYSHALSTTLWSEWRTVSFAGSVSFTAPGATNPATTSASTGRREAVSATSALTPTLTPVTGLTVTPASGVPSSAYGPLTGVGLTPTLSWSPPFTGTATSYLVEVFRLDRSGTNLVNTTITQVAALVTTATQAAIPSGVLTAGSAHFVRVTVRSIPSDPAANAPFRRVVLGAWAQTLSGTITP